ncbi:hypothetical protein PHLGIDRAFT_18806 [Phlebiopsis gigantea 11061_1 CR5-6]|uniref:Phytocyanin domain-containing protein n=1 Tax=Phlebiopsis gigantea (strain 11061_1 CR5-6) TaxID=745531 RepID=A0A0C3NUB5_PHLG1|nr:hypothetical protein PHLGIDRAFT_18806 [Phlebiopsis gigantea 11061_1 CR5-6]
MRFSAILAALPLIGAAFAETIVVKVGENGTLTYNPSEVTAQNGDTIAFQFLTKNHTITQSTFASPCTNFSATGLDSGFQPVAANATSFMEYSFNMTNVTGPLWFYCRQANHCQMGMVFAVNPTADKPFSAFQAAAMGKTAAANATASMSGSSGASSPTDTSSSSTPSASTTSGAMSLKTRGAIVLSGVGLVAGLLL